jgi:hypothetical protein
MGKMNICILPVLLSVIKGVDVKKIHEAIDAIGYLCFYNSVEDKNAVLDLLYNCYMKYKADSIVRWKIAVCLSAFRCTTAIQMVNELYRDETQELIKEEIKRTLSHIAEITK